MLCTACHTSPLWPSLLFRVARWQLVCSLDFEWVQSGYVCVKHSDVLRYFKNKYCHALCNPSLSSFPRIKKKIPDSHNNIAENLKWFISWLIYFVITDLLVNSRIIFFAFCLFMLFLHWIFSLCCDSCSWKMLPKCINSNEIICASHVHTQRCLCISWVPRKAFLKRGKQMHIIYFLFLIKNAS